MDPATYVRNLLSKPVVPRCCAWPSWLGVQFEMYNDYSNFSRECEIVHLLSEESWLLDAPKCSFVAKPLVIVETGVCPVCGRREFTPFDNPTSLKLNAKSAYRAIVNVYTEHAMRYYLVDHWDDVKRQNMGRLHVDHIYPVNRGFKHGVAEAIIGSPVNCQLIPAKDNLRKGEKPGQSLDELLSRYTRFVSRCLDWSELQGILDSTGRL